MYKQQQQQVSPARGASAAEVTTTKAVTKPTASAGPGITANQTTPSVQTHAADDTPLNALTITALQARIRALSQAQW